MERGFLTPQRNLHLVCFETTLCSLSFFVSRLRDWLTPGDVTYAILSGTRLISVIVGTPWLRNNPVSFGPLLLGSLSLPAMPFSAE